MMNTPEIDYDALKKRGFLRQKQDGFFLLRARMRVGNFSSAQLRKIADIADEFGRGFVHVTTRQGIEIPFIQHKDIDRVEQSVRAAGIETGTSGPRLRTTTCCPGTNWCKSALVDPWRLYDRIEKELNLRCAMDLQHKFKISLSGCPNTCTRAQQSEIGVHGEAGMVNGIKSFGYAVYTCGCGGRTPRIGFKLDRLFSEDDVLGVIGRIVDYYRKHARPRQRLALLVEEAGKESFLSAIHEKAKD